MSAYDSATVERRELLPPRGAGLGWGLLGVVAFSFTLPLTRVAVGSLSPLFIGAGRAVLAAVLAAISLAVTGQRPPRGRQWLRLGVVAAGVVAGFPLLSSYALARVPAAHGAVVIAVLPAATAAVAVLRAREHPSPRFWLAAVLGALAAVAFAATRATGPGGLQAADLLLFGAIAAAAVGYAEGGLLARELGAWQTVSWALVVGAPVMLALCAVSVAGHRPTGSGVQWACFAYLGVVSMFLGFFAWYRGLAIGPMAQVSQTQLGQPVLSLCWAAVLLGERLTWTTAVGALAVVACAGIAVRTRAASRAGRAVPGAPFDRGSRRPGRAAGPDAG